MYAYVKIDQHSYPIIIAELKLIVVGLRQNEKIELSLKPSYTFNAVNINKIF